MLFFEAGGGGGESGTIPILEKEFYSGNSEKLMQMSPRWRYFIVKMQAGTSLFRGDFP